jgi:hypothetical protein
VANRIDDSSLSGIIFTDKRGHALVELHTENRFFCPELAKILDLDF